MPASANVTVLGAGVLGAQIAFQAANHGKTVTSYDVDDAALEAARGRLDAIVAQFVSESGEETRESATAAAAGITLTSDLAASVADADLVIEAVPERLDLKQDVYRRIAEAAPERTVFATNSSTLLPSDIADSTGRPDRFLALHFANHVWRQNTAEIMGTERTSPEVFDRVVAFAEEIGMVPIPLKKEQPGYVLNSLLGAASGLVLTGVADPKTVDTTWRIATGAPLGPFQIFDLSTAYAVSAASDEPGAQAWAAHLKSEYLDKGKLGRESGEGFYAYR
ncbi:3-hydroxyacyl-CoA dehydrogenase [Clavibacter michiganensis]|uniref:3-hydroxyacyl-CoA dehydrogenase n=1 Tax=Clavibacter michiganensis TaxID=28447 RepID=UPI000A395EA2|nr:3-hydroxyacyl-CoA dehydrogenase [Clavibacter michiganensis]OUD89226.1 putative 3-hydroxybutyryl-CoA dehydrogenase [Clavibacter michiganensis subsp. michiganensis]OUE11612.1 putative 3-hydroxybutyryl-CoA dehydrogenase [Clavibacter michiganensis subsp. michiganensis]